MERIPSYRPWAAAILLPALLAAGLPAEESGMLRWDFAAPDHGWVPWGTSGDTPAEAAARVLARDDGGLRITDQDSGRNLYAAAGRTLAVPGGTRCRLAGRCRTAGGPAELAVMAEGPDPGRGNRGACARTVIAGSAAWQDFTLSFTVPAELAGAGLRVVAHPVAEAAPAATGSLWLRELVLASTRARPLDLDPVRNRGLEDTVAGDGAGGWTDQGDNDLSGLASGPLPVGGLAFAIRARAAGAAVLALAEDRAGFARGAEVPAAGLADHVCLLHAAAWSRSGQQVGDLVFRYADGGEAAVAVADGEAVGDWWNGCATAAAVCTLPTEANPCHSPVHLFAAAIANPHPGRALAGVGFRAGRAMWLVLDAQLASGPSPVEALAPAERDRSSWAVFAPGPAGDRPPLVDCSALLDAPAGRHGFVRARDGHFSFADGTPARFLGTNIYPSCWFPTHAQAERAATTLARYGINLVRLHLPRNALVERGQKDRQSFIPAARWEPFDYLLKQLRDRGIYVVLCSATGLSGVGAGAEADGVLPGYGECKPWLYWVPRLAELGQRFLAGYLGHVNPYTGLALLDDPAVAGILLVNEQPSLWWGMAPLPDPYRELIEGAFAAWLGRAWPDRPALAAAWGDELGGDEDPWRGRARLAPLPGMPAIPAWSARGPRRIAATVAFLRDLQIGHDRACRDQLVRLGCKVPVAGTNMLLFPAELDGQRRNDFISQHAYYDHVQRLGGDLRTGTMQCGNIPAVELDRLHGRGAIEEVLAAAKVAGLPLVSTETDTMWPHEWRSGYLLSLAAAACLQDWDAPMHYGFIGGGGSSWDGFERAPAIFPTVEGNDPAIAGLYPAAALLFHRRDVAPARALVQVVYDQQDRLHPEPTLRSPGFPFSYLAHVCRVESVFDGGGGADARIGPAGERSFPWSCSERGRSIAADTRALDAALKQWGVIPAGSGLGERRLVSDTGEIVRDWGRGLLLVDSPRTQGFSGFPAGPMRLGAVTIELDGDFATVVVSSLDHRPIAEAGRLLVTAVARAENTRDRYAAGQEVAGAGGRRREERLVVQRVPGGEVRIEPVRAVLRLAGREAVVTPLDRDLAALAPGQAVAGREGRLELRLGGSTTWHLVEVGRP
jgi:hypothetical protein